MAANGCLGVFFFLLIQISASKKHISVLFVGNSLTSTAVPSFLATLCSSPAGPLDLSWDVSWAGGMTFRNHAVDPSEYVPRFAFLLSIFEPVSHNRWIPLGSAFNMFESYRNATQFNMLIFFFFQVHSELAGSHH